jgi:hypothetical protein
MLWTTAYLGRGRRIKLWRLIRRDVVHAYKICQGLFKCLLHEVFACDHAHNRVELVHDGQMAQPHRLEEVQTARHASHHKDARCEWRLGGWLQLLNKTHAHACQRSGGGDRVRCGRDERSEVDRLLQGRGMKLTLDDVDRWEVRVRSSKVRRGDRRLRQPEKSASDITWSGQRR